MVTPVCAYGFSAGSGATAADDSGNGHTLTISNASWTASGHTGAGLTNTASNNIGGSSTVPAVSGSTCTLMCWVKPLALPASGTNFACGVVQSGGGTDLAIFTQRGSFGTANVLQCDIRIGGGLLQIAGSALTVGTWYHVAVTFDGTNIKLYVGGSLVNTVSNTGSVAHSTTFYVAGANTSAAFGTNVVVDDVRYFNTDESANITTWMNTPSGASGVTLVAASETDTATALGRTKSLTLGRATETDTGQALTRKKQTQVGRASETDTANGLARSKSVSLNRSAETATAQGVTRTKAASLGRASEVETAAVLGRVKAALLGRAAETDTSSGLSRAKSLGLIRASTTMSAQSLSRRKSVTIGSVLESDLATSLGSLKPPVVLGRAVETDTAQVVVTGLQVDLEVEPGPIQALWTAGPAMLRWECDNSSLAWWSGGVVVDR